MIKSVLALLAAGACAWGAGRAPGPPVMPEDYRIAHISVAGWQERTQVVLAGCESNSAGLSLGSVRVWVVGEDGVTEALPRVDYSFRGSSGAVDVNLPPSARRLVVRADDHHGHREARSFFLR